MNKNNSKEYVALDVLQLEGSVGEDGVWRGITLLIPSGQELRMRKIAEELDEIGIKITGTNFPWRESEAMRAKKIGKTVFPSKTTQG